MYQEYFQHSEMMDVKILYCHMLEVIDITTLCCQYDGGNRCKKTIGDRCDNIVFLHLSPPSRLYCHIYHLLLLSHQFLRHTSSHGGTLGAKMAETAHIYF